LGRKTTSDLEAAADRKILLDLVQHMPLLDLTSYMLETASPEGEVEQAFAEQAAEQLAWVILRGWFNILYDQVSGPGKSHVRLHEDLLPEGDRQELFGPVMAILDDWGGMELDKLMAFLRSFTDRFKSDIEKVSLKIFPLPCGCVLEREDKNYAFARVA
jgi:hypothetical protein